MRIRTSLLLTGTLLALLATPAAAHRQWLLPSSTIVSDTQQWVTVDAAVSNDLFYADHQPMGTDNIKVWAPDGSLSQIQNASRGRYRSTFDVKLDQPGTWKIGTAMNGVSGTFKVAGEEWRVGGRGGPPGGGAPGGMAPGGAGPAAAAAPAPGQPPRPPVRSVATVADIPANATDIKLSESSSRNEIFVTAGAPTTKVLQPTGKGLEMVPITHPSELVADETARFRFLIDGKPAASLKVTVIPGGKRYRDAEGAVDLTTGADGVLEIKWPMAGMFWINATATDAKATTPNATQRRMSYTTTVEVHAP